MTFLEFYDSVLYNDVSINELIYVLLIGGAIND